MTELTKPDAALAGASACRHQRFSLWQLLTALLLAVACHAGMVQAADEYLPPEAAFRFSATMPDPNTVSIHYLIADGYYLYREPFRFAAQGATLGAPSIPPGKIKFDQTFQKDVETYRHEITITVPVEAAAAFTLTAVAQGCADQGLCYPPMASSAKLPPAKGFLAALGLAPGAALIDRPAALAASSTADQVVVPARAGITPVVAVAPSGFAALADDSIHSSLQAGRLWVILPLFLLLGLGLAFTPCVLPMVPILSSIIVGTEHKSAATGGQRRRQHFSLALSYSLGMALVYTALGVAAGLAGEGLAAGLQNPWLLSAFALLMVGLALSMFGFYELQLPAALQTRLVRASASQRGGHLPGVFVMGAISALIVGPCVAAPLAGALVYISQTRNVLIGGSALFAMALGMSVPLLLIGWSAHTLLPRAGAWMAQIKHFFGVLLLALAWWMLASLLPVTVQMAGWAALGIGYGAYLLWRPSAWWAARAFGIAFTALGLMQLLGAVSGARAVSAPLALWGQAPAAQLEFVAVRSNAELDAALARADGRMTMLDFYADWCVSCKEMEKFTFSQPQIQRQLGAMQLLRVDVTANDANDRALLKRFGLFGPPGIIFFDNQANERRAARVIGYQNAQKFEASLLRARQAGPKS